MRALQPDAEHTVEKTLFLLNYSILNLRESTDPLWHLLQSMAKLSSPRTGNSQEHPPAEDVWALNSIAKQGPPQGPFPCPPLSGILKTFPRMAAAAVTVAHCYLREET